MSQVTPINEAFIFEGSSVISQTDLKGIITYVNRQFCKVSGYTADELIGQPHHIIRHPNMPKIVFEKMWNTISTGHSWNGLIKNLRKDGRYYWLDTEILPIKNENDELTGYIAARKPASRQNIEEFEETYKRLYEDKE